MAITKQFIDRQMFCPRCLSKLKKGENLKVYESIADHVTNPNGEPYPKEYYYCSNDSCPTIASEMFWDPYGDDYRSLGRIDNNLFILNHSEAINSASRENSLRQHTISTPLLKINKFSVELKRYLIPNNRGTTIIGYKYKIVLLIKTGIVYTYYTPGIVSFFFCIKDFYYDYNSFINERAPWTIRDVLKHLEGRDRDKRWWKLLSTWILNKRYPKLKSYLKSLLK